MPENQNIIKLIEETEFDLIIGDPIEMLGPLLSWKYDIPLSFNTRWAMYGDAGELLTGESNYDHLVLTHWTLQFEQFKYFFGYMDPRTIGRSI